jgi:hypothetical protein
VNLAKVSKKKFKFGDHVLWFPKGHKTHIGKFTKKSFGPYKVQLCLPNNIVFLIMVDKFAPNLVLVNINKLKCTNFWMMKHRLQTVHDQYIGKDKVMLMLMTKKRTIMKY